MARRDATRPGPQQQQQQQQSSGQQSGRVPASAARHVPAETDAARHARDLYAAQVAPRSLARLAQQLRDEQEAAAQRALELGQPPPRVQHVAVIERRVKQWSSDHRWQEYVRRRDDEERAQRRRQVTSGVAEMNTIHQQVNRGVYIQAMTVVNDLLQEDQQERDLWRQEVERWRAEVARFLAMPEVERMGEEPPKRPARPKPHFGPYALVQLAKLTFDSERIAWTGQDALTDDEVATAPLPDVLEVTLTTQPPPIPRDPDELREELIRQLSAPAPAVVDAREPLQPLDPAPRAMIGLSGRPPRPPRDAEADDDDDDDGYGSGRGGFDDRDE